MSLKTPELRATIDELKAIKAEYYTIWDQWTEEFQELEDALQDVGVAAAVPITLDVVNGPGMLAFDRFKTRWRFAIRWQDRPDRFVCNLSRKDRMIVFAMIPTLLGKMRDHARNDLAKVRQLAVRTSRGAVVTQDVIASLAHQKSLTRSV